MRSWGAWASDWVDVILCHKGDLADPTVYLEGFEALKDEGCLRAYGISTNDLEVLQAFQPGRHVQCGSGVDYSLLNQTAEEAFLRLLPGTRHRGDGAGPFGKRAAVRPLWKRFRLHRLGTRRVECGRFAAGAVPGAGCAGRPPGRGRLAGGSDGAGGDTLQPSAMRRSRCRSRGPSRLLSARVNAAAGSRTLTGEEWGALAGGGSAVRPPSRRGVVLGWIARGVNAAGWQEQISETIQEEGYENHGYQDLPGLGGGTQIR